MDTYSVVYSPAARDDLFGIYTYIATELLEPEIAAKQTVRIRNAIRKLEQLPASHASTRASMAEKSATMKRHPSLGMNAVRMISESVPGTEPNSSSSCSSSPLLTMSLAR